MIRTPGLAKKMAARLDSLEKRVEVLEVEAEERAEALEVEALKGLNNLLEQMRRQDPTKERQEPPGGDSIHDPRLSKGDLDQKLDAMVLDRNEWFEKKAKWARQDALLRPPSHSRRVRSHYSEPLLREWMEAAFHPDRCPLTPSCPPRHCRHFLVDTELTRKPALVFPGVDYRAYLSTHDTQAVKPCFVCLLAQTGRSASLWAYDNRGFVCSALVFEDQPLCRACETACFHDLEKYDFCPSEKQVLVVLIRPYVRYCD